jgi:hypothetical protein
MIRVEMERSGTLDTTPQEGASELLMSAGDFG